MKIKDFLAPLPPGSITTLSFSLVFMIGFADYHLDPELSTSIFYVMPVAISAWYGSRRLGLAITIFSALIWLLTDALSGAVYSSSVILYWNGAVRLGLFLIISLSLAGFREQLTVEENLADTDTLTGVYNRRAFYEKLEREIRRSERFSRPFSLAYVDLDNFKQINDSLGHYTGDELLKKVVTIMQAKTRITDVIARLGGDEFALLMVETGYEAAEDAMGNLHGHLLAAMKDENWPVTFSIGLVICENPPRDVDEVLNFADSLMYSVKNSGKNRIAKAKLE